MATFQWAPYEALIEQASSNEWMEQWDFLPLGLMWADEHDIADAEGMELDLGGLMLLGETSDGGVYALLVDEEDFTEETLNAAPVLMILPDGRYTVIAADFSAFVVLMAETGGTPYELIDMEEDTEIEAMLETRREEMGEDDYEFGQRVLVQMGLVGMDIVQLILDAQAIDVEL